MQLGRTKTGGVLLIVLLLVLWELASINNWVKSVLFPPMTAILSTWVTLTLSGELITQLAASLQRVAIGYGLAIVLGVLLGLLMGYFEVFYNLFEPLTELLRPIPSPAYIPIAILFLGIDDPMKIFMIFFACVFPILLNTYTGVRSVDPVQINTGRTFGLSPARIVWRIVIPASSPYTFAGMRISLAVALILAVISEMVAANNGIGYFILSTQRSFLVKEMYAGLVTLAVVGYGLNRLFLALEGWLLAWHIGSTKLETV